MNLNDLVAKFNKLIEKQNITDTNFDCTNTIDSKHCVNSHNIVKCSNSENILSCKLCDNCISCTDCCECVNCKNVHNAYMCINCNNSCHMICCINITDNFRYMILNEPVDQETFEKLKKKYLKSVMSK